MHANEIPKAKIDANKDVDKQVQALIDEIDRNPNLTDKEKQALKDDLIKYFNKVITTLTMR